MKDASAGALCPAPIRACNITTVASALQFQIRPALMGGLDAMRSSDSGPISRDRTTADSEECCVCVAVQVRPLIDGELIEGCQNCLTTLPNQPQVKSTHTQQYSGTRLLVYAEVLRIQPRSSNKRAVLLHCCVSKAWWTRIL